MNTDSAYLDDIADAARRNLTYVGDMDEMTFLADRKTQDAVVRQIEIMGEAATRVSTEMKSIHPEIDWATLTRLRNFYIHVYRRVNYSMVWITNRNTIPRILTAVERLMSVEEGHDG